MSMIQILIGLGMLLIFSYLQPIVSHLPVSVISNNRLAAWMQFPVVFSTDMIKRENKS